MNNNRTGGIQHLLLKHIEKVVVLVVLGVAGYLISAASGVETYTKDSSELTQAVTQATNSWKNFTWSDAPEENVKVSFDPTSDNAAKVSVDLYAPVRDWSRPVVPPTVDRVDPPLLAATDVEGVGVTGLMAFINEDIIRKRRLEEERLAAEEARRQQEEAEEDDDRGRGARGGRGGRGGRDEEDEEEGRPAGNPLNDSGISIDGDELIRTVSCAVVVAKAPLMDQYKSYKELLENARGYNASNDFPVYEGYLVERAEVRGGKTGPWTAVPVQDGQGRTIGRAYNLDRMDKLVEEWVTGGEPIMDPAYEDPAITMPLPPLVGEGWPTRVVHRDVPLLVETEAAEEAAEAREDEPEEDLNADDEFGFGGERATRRGSRRGGAPGARRGGGSRRGGRSIRGEEGGGRGPRSGGRSGGSRRRVTEPETPHLMVRFFDFTAEPGRQYRYRVRLVLTDVNNPQLVATSYLDPAAASRVTADNYRAYRFADWSEPSSVVSIPMAGDAHIVGVKQPGKGQANSEGRVKFLVRAYDVDIDGRATRSGVEKEFPVGSVMTFTEDAEVLSSDQQRIIKADDFAFNTGITLCDFEGGSEITRDYKTPIRTLLMDAAGKLFVRHELDDQEAIANHKAVFEEDDERGGFRGGGPRGGRGGRGRGPGGGRGEF